MIPHVIVLEPGLVIFKSTTATGFLADRPSKSYGKTARCVEEMPAGLGDHYAGAESRLGTGST